MELTGKCKVEFEKYLIEHKHFIISVETDWNAIWFNCSDSMKFGVLQDYFWSVKIPTPIDWVLIILGYKTRPEERTAAIEKACEIRNEQLKD